MAKEEEERRERQKKLDAILKRSSVKMDVPKVWIIDVKITDIFAKFFLSKLILNRGAGF